MLRQIASNQDKQGGEIIEIGDLGMFPNKEAIYHLDELTTLKLGDGTPECTFATPWLRTDLGCLRVSLTVIHLVKECPEYHLALSGRKAEDTLQHLAHLVKAFKKELR